MKNYIPTYEFQKNAVEKVVIQLTEYMGHQVIDLRVFYNANAGGAKEEWKPSPKGLCVRIGQILELKTGVDRALKEWETKNK